MGASQPRNPGLLVSVRSAVEAEAALRGGATLIDVKEPTHGPLGRAKDAIIAAVLQRVAGRLPVSAALGELVDADNGPCPGPGLSFVKWGLAGVVPGTDWRHRLRERTAVVAGATPGCRAVAVAYADWRDAGAPPPDEVLAYAAQRPGGVLLVDTYRKTPRRTLLDFLPVAEVSRLRQACAAAGVLLALAGSLGREEIAALLPVRPDWFAVRGAACAGGQRGGVVEEARVRGLAELIAAAELLPGALDA